MASSPPSDPSRPSDHIDAPEQQKGGITQPRLGVVGYLRFFWRQLTSMRTALFLLLLLAIAAIPGSLVPQVSSDPNGVIQYKAANPGITPLLEFLQVFNTYTSVWFSAIYLLLFISLIGCVIPRTKHHLDALRARPPKTPARLERLEGFTTRETAADATTAVEAARLLLRRQGYRTQVYASTGSAQAAPDSVSAERGYLRETGNLIFHTALIGVLFAIGFGGGFGYTGQRVVVEGQTMINSRASYDSFNPGRFFTDSALEPYSIALDDLDVKYYEGSVNAYGQVIDYTASVTTKQPGRDPEKATVKVNSPLDIGGTQVYLLGNGYAPVVTVRDPDGAVVFSSPTAFIPLEGDSNLSSVGVVKLPDGLDEPLALRGLLYPTRAELDSGALTSIHPDLLDPMLTLEVFQGDPGLDDGQYVLNTDDMTEIAGRNAPAPTIELGLGDKAELPNGLGTVELTAIPRFVSFDVHHDPAQGWVLLFAVLVVGGLVTSLFVPRRRVWVKAVAGDGGTITLEYAGLARGDDPGLDAAVAEIAQKHIDQPGLKVGP